MTVAPSPVGAAGYLREGEPEGLLVEVVGPRGVGGDGDHLGPAGLEGFLVVPVGAGDDAGLPEAEGEGAGGSVEEVGEGHG